MSDRTMYVKSVEVLNPRYVEAYTYRRQGENFDKYCKKQGLSNEEIKEFKRDFKEML
ncbi:hypothetical protein [Staphylococcus equorum]|uniref:hypothetical protein n=1 Tax=Staphylococcus equorum TaxID=246432 RepID=UPI0021BF8401|nr:hypothetical protein [Staphylococcus equorum]